MTKFSVSIKGEKELQKTLKKLSNVDKLFNKDVKKTARDSQGQLLRNTNKLTGHTQHWLVKKIASGHYVVFNTVLTDDKKYFVVDILNEGRRAVYPKPSNARGLLYIPLTEKGRAKDKGGKFGIDFVYAKSAKAFKGTKFIDKEQKRAVKQLVKLILKRLDKI